MGELVNETFEQEDKNESPYILNEDLKMYKSFDPSFISVECSKTDLSISEKLWEIK